MPQAGESFTFEPSKIPWGIAALRVESKYLRPFWVHLPIRTMGFYSFTSKVATIIFLPR